MEIIISKAFLQNFYENFDAENDYYSDFEKFLRRNICNDFVLITDFTEQELYSSLTWTQYPILKDIEQKSAHTEFETQLLDKVEQIAFYQQSSAFKLFCIEKSDADCEKLKENFGFLYLNSTNIDSE